MPEDTLSVVWEDLRKEANDCLQEAWSCGAHRQDHYDNGACQVGDKEALQASMHPQSFSAQYFKLLH